MLHLLHLAYPVRPRIISPGVDRHKLLAMDSIQLRSNVINQIHILIHNENNILVILAFWATYASKKEGAEFTVHQVRQIKYRPCSWAKCCAAINYF